MKNCLGVNESEWFVSNVKENSRVYFYLKIHGMQ